MIGADGRQGRHRAAARRPASSRPRSFIVLSPLIGFAARRADHGRRVVDLLPPHATPRRPLVPATAAGVERALQHRPRQQRCAEDHGHHLAAADRAGVTTRDHLPVWVIICCYIAIAVGTLFGGWRIIKTMGQRITKLQPGRRLRRRDRRRDRAVHRLRAAASRSRRRTPSPARSSASARPARLNAVRWGVSGNIVLAWMLTIPCSAFMAALAWWLGPAGYSERFGSVGDRQAGSTTHDGRRPATYRRRSGPGTRRAAAGSRTSTAPIAGADAREGAAGRPASAAAVFAGARPTA